MDWSTFMARRRARLTLATAAQAGDRAALARAWQGWAFTRDPDLLRRVEAVLRATTPALDPASLMAGLGPEDTLPTPTGAAADTSEPLHRLWLVRTLAARKSVTPPAEDQASLLWTIEAIAFFGESVEDRERAAWGREAYPENPKEDAQTAALWARMFQGGPAVWKDQKAWEALCMPPAMASYRQVLSTRELPPGVAKQALTELRDGLWFQLLGGKDSTPGWAELAARVLETMGGAAALALALDTQGLGLAAGCAGVRGTWPTTLAQLVPEVPGGPARALWLRQRLADDPERVEPILDAHAALRLLQTWEAPEGVDPVRSWNVVVQNRGRARGRLRALAMADPGRIRPILLSLDGLHERTLAAMRRYAWDQCWESMARGFAWDFTHTVTAPCREVSGGLEPLDAADIAAIRTWVLLVVLKGRRGHLIRWVQTGGTGDRDGTWGRLLNDELPDGLRDPEPSGRAASYHRLRAWLHDGLDEALAGLRPVLARIAALPEGRALARSMEALLAPTWDARVPFPKAGFPTFQAHAIDALQATEAAS